MAEWVDSPEYLAAVDEAVSVFRGTGQEAPHRFTWTDLAHFDGIIGRAASHESLRGKVILDSGCGAAGLCVRLLASEPSSVIGLEIDERSGPLAELRAKRDSRLRILRTLDAMDALEDASVDVVFSLHVIEHVGDPRQYLYGLGRVLKPGGLLVLQCPHRLALREAHSGVPLLQLLPKALGAVIAKTLARAPLLNSQTRDRLDMVFRSSHFFEAELRRIVESAGFLLEPHDDVARLHEYLGRSPLRGLRPVAQRVPRALAEAALRFRWNLELFARRR